MQLPLYRPEGEWQPVSRTGLIGWMVFYGLFLLYAWRARGGFLLIDHVNLVIHEGGHFFFSWFGYTMTILGGTLMELIVPLCIAVYFWWHRQTAGLAFALFWMFENFLYIGSYMADARSLSLPLVGSGDHDWEILFGQWGVLHKDRIIGARTTALGWIGMLATLGWFAWFAWRKPPAPAKRTL